MFTGTEMYKYLVSLYYSVLFIGLNEMAPVNEVEMIGCIGLLIFCVFQFLAFQSDLAVQFYMYQMKA